MGAFAPMSQNATTRYAVLNYHDECIYKAYKWKSDGHKVWFETYIYY
jgi:hypothetical protein